MAVRPRPQTPYVVTQRYLRYVGKDCLVAFDANLYSVLARRVRPRQLVGVRAMKSQIMPHAIVPGHSGEALLATHSRALVGAPRSWMKSTETPCPRDPAAASQPVMGAHPGPADRTQAMNPGRGILAETEPGLFTQPRP